MHKSIVVHLFNLCICFVSGDDLYTDECDEQGVQKSIEYPFALEDLRTRSKNLHRMEIRGPQCTIYCNISPRCGHLQPLTFRSSQPVVQSFL